MLSRHVGLVSMAGLSLFLAGCPLHWIAQDDGAGASESARAAVQHHRGQLAVAVAQLEKAKVGFPIRETGLFNTLGFESARQETVLAIYTNGNLVNNNMTRFQRAVGSLGDDASKVLRILDAAGLLDPNPDYHTLKLTQFYRVRDAIMTSDIGGAITAEPEGAIFFFPLASAKDYAENRLDQKALINKTVIESEDGQPLAGHLY